VVGRLRTYATKRKSTSSVKGAIWVLGGRGGERIWAGNKKTIGEEHLRLTYISKKLSRRGRKKKETSSEKLQKRWGIAWHHEEKVILREASQG